MNTPIADLFEHLGFEAVAARVIDNYIHEPNTGCWLWAGRWAESKPGDLRPRINLMNHEFMAYRLMYWLRRGAFDESKLICHTCDVGVCVNPDHLYVGDFLTNVRDCITRGRAWHQVDPLAPSRWGHKGGKALSIIFDSDLEEISRRQRSGVRYREIAAEYGVAESTVSTRVSRYRRAALAQSQEHDGGAK